MSNDLWVAAGYDPDTEKTETAILAARTSLAPSFSVAAKAQSADEFSDICSMISPRIESVVASVVERDPVLFPIVHQAVLESWDRDFAILQSHRVTEAQRAHVAALRATADRKREAAVGKLPPGWNVEMLGLINAVKFTDGTKTLMWGDGQWTIEQNGVHMNAPGVPMAKDQASARKAGTDWLNSVFSDDEVTASKTAASQGGFQGAVNVGMMGGTNLPPENGAMLGMWAYIVNLPIPGSTYVTIKSDIQTQDRDEAERWGDALLAKWPDGFPIDRKTWQPMLTEADVHEFMNSVRKQSSKTADFHVVNENTGDVSDEGFKTKPEAENQSYGKGYRVEYTEKGDDPYPNDIKSDTKTSALTVTAEFQTWEASVAVTPGNSVTTEVMTAIPGAMDIENIGNSNALTKVRFNCRAGEVEEATGHRMWGFTRVSSSDTKTSVLVVTAGADWSGGWARKAPATNPNGGVETWGTRILPDGTVVQLHRGPHNHVRFYDEQGNQHGTEQSNVAPAFAFAESKGWYDPDSVSNHWGPIGGSDPYQDSVDAYQDKKKASLIVTAADGGVRPSFVVKTLFDVERAAPHLPPESRKWVYETIVSGSWLHGPGTEQGIPSDDPEFQKCVRDARKMPSTESSLKTALTAPEADQFVAGFPPEYQARAEALKKYTIYGPDYDRIVTEHLDDARRHLPFGSDSYGDIYLAKAESVAHYRETGEWVDPFSGQAQMEMNASLINWTKAGPDMWTTEHEGRCASIARLGRQFVFVADGQSGEVEGSESSMLRATAMVISVLASDYTKTPKAVTLKDGTKISDVMGSDPDPGHADGKKWVGYTDSGEKRTWHNDDVVSTDDAEYRKNTSWVDERMDQQKTEEQRGGKYEGSRTAASSVPEESMEESDPRVKELREKGNSGKGRTKAESDELLALVKKHRGLASRKVAEFPPKKKTDDDKAPAKDDGSKKENPFAKKDDAKPDAAPVADGAPAANPADPNVDPNAIPPKDPAAVDPNALPQEDDSQNLPSADPSTMDIGQSSMMTYTMEDGNTGEVEVTFVREENAVFFFNGPTGEFGVGNQNGAWQDPDGSTFSFASTSKTQDDDPNASTNDSQPNVAPKDNKPKIQSGNPGAEMFH